MFLRLSLAILINSSMTSSISSRVEAMGLFYKSTAGARVEFALLCGITRGFLSKSTIAYVVFRPRSVLHRIVSIVALMSPSSTLLAARFRKYTACGIPSSGISCVWRPS